MIISDELNNKILNMDMGHRLYVHSGISILRIKGGWIYEYWGKHGSDTFVTATCYVPNTIKL
jgi:hypothetical protein